jgi:hypothetical protein
METSFRCHYELDASGYANYGVDEYKAFIKFIAYFRLWVSRSIHLSYAV